MGDPDARLRRVQGGGAATDPVGTGRLWWFHLLTKWSFRLRRRWTVTGALVGWGVVLAGAFGLDTHRSMAYQLFALLLALIVGSWVATWRFRVVGAAVERRLPPYATVGEPLVYPVVVQNRGGKGLAHVWVSEEVAHAEVTPQEFAAAREPGEEGRNWFDRKVGFSRYAWLAARKRGVRLSDVELPQLSPGDEAEVLVQVQPLRRGVVMFPPWVSLARTDPLGLCWARRAVAVGPKEGSGRLLVLPRRYALPAALFASGGRCYQPGGVSQAARVGDAEEFVAVREYREGDSPRRIHWPSWAKQGRPMVKEYQQEYFVRHALVLDTFQPAGAEEVFEEAVAVAASFAADLVTGESLLELMFVGEKGYRFTFGRGMGPVEEPLAVLAAVVSSGEDRFVALAETVRFRAAELSDAILVLTGWDEQRRQLMQHLLMLRLPVWVLVVTKVGGGVGVPPGVVVLEVGRVAEGLQTMAGVWGGSSPA